MKKSLVLFPRQTYQNESDNKKRLYWLPDGLSRVVGQAKAVRYQLIGFRASANCEIKLYMYESPWDGARAQDVKPGGSAFHTLPTALSSPSLRNEPTTIQGPFAENVSMALEIKHSTDAAQVEWEGLVAATLILEE